ncbi:MAG: dihydropteroate synthase, partial [Anaerolineae bacterium]|nr:dihydropteroate synthase [Anaerolineae bacterium]
MQSSLTINKRNFIWGQRTYIMGILNITPDSFSGDGLASEKDPVAAALAQASQFVQAGADMLDIGGESTRPGSEPVEAKDEIARVLPIIQAVAAAFDLPISIDTYKADVAAAALEAGAHLINDVWGLRADPELARLVARRRVPVIIMHNRSTPKNTEVRDRLGGRYTGVEYTDLIADIKQELLDSVALAQAAGIAEENVILDPGIGFG